MVLDVAKGRTKERTEERREEKPKEEGCKLRIERRRRLTGTDIQLIAIVPFANDEATGSD